MRSALLLLCASIAFAADEKPAPADPRTAIDRQDLQNVLVAARRSIGLLPAQDLVFVALSIQRLEAIAEKIPKPEAKPEAKPKD